jgi:hypothetical protein
MCLMPHNRLLLSDCMGDNHNVDPGIDRRVVPSSLPDGCQVQAQVCQVDDEQGVQGRFLWGVRSMPMRQQGNAVNFARASSWT